MAKKKVENNIEIVNGSSEVEVKEVEVAKDHEIIHKADIFNQKECEVCKAWMTFCVAEPPEESTAETIEKWYREKQAYWNANEKHLAKNGYVYDSSIVKSLDIVELEKVNDLEGSLLIVRVGSDNRPAPTSEIEYAYQMMEKALEGVKGVRVIITDHKFTVEKVSLPQLRMLQSSVLSSVEPEDNAGSIIRDLEV